MSLAMLVFSARTSFSAERWSSSLESRSSFVKGENAWITIQKFPFEEEDQPRWVIERGTIRRRKEQD